MPISAEAKAKYPANWREISDWVRFFRADARCECTGECGEGHRGRCTAVHKMPHPRTRSAVVLTVAHLDHDPGNTPTMCELAASVADFLKREKLAKWYSPACPRWAKFDYLNLKAMCQQCHLRYDRHLHAANAATTRDRKSGQTRLEFS